MGIKNLWQFLKKYGQQVQFRDFSGKTAAIDASCWLHKALYVSMSQNGNRERCGDIFRAHLRAVKGNGITPFVVFDGLPLPAKASEDERRQRDRENRQSKADDLNISVEDATKLRSQAIAITFGDITSCINICLSEDVKYIVAPYESDAQIASLLLNGFADFAITEDSDLLAYGCKKLICKASLSGEGECFTLSEVLDGLKLTFTQFQQMCIAAGCDYLKNIFGIGISRAYSLVSSGNDLLKLLTERGATKEYQEGFDKAEAVFQHQTVFDISSCTTVPLKMWESDPPIGIQFLCGNKLDECYANDLAVGNVDTKSGKKINSYPNFLKTCATTEEDQGLDGRERGSAQSASEPHGDENWCQAMKCEIIQINHFFSFSWRIPCFPVMAIEFVYVCFKKGSDILDGVIQKDAVDNVQRGVYNCTSHCQIRVESKPYTVLWTLIPVQKAGHTAPSVSVTTVSDSDTSDDDIDSYEHSDPVATHCLPFKVMGTCYSKARQDGLQEAFEYLYEHNRPVYARLQAEPENTHDKNAIAVYLMSSSDYEKVGYIATELTRYLHPLLNDPSLEVSVKNIRFCTTFLMIGFYVTINITKRGQWDKQVIRASRTVK